MNAMLFGFDFVWKAGGKSVTEPVVFDPVISSSPELLKKNSFAALLDPVAN